MNLLRPSRKVGIERPLFVFLFIAILLSGHLSAFAGQTVDPVKIVVAGLVHGHVDDFLKIAGSSDEVEVVGIYESDSNLLSRYGSKYRIASKKRFADLAQMLDSTSPDIVIAFSNTSDHLQIVELAAPLGIHVIVEKPLAINLGDAEQMASLAEQHEINLLVNFVSTWFSSNQVLYEYVKQKELIGPIRKMVSKYGHQGPKEIGVSQEFLSWLVDPAQSGGGAIADFGCYGANLMTWLMGNRKPVSVTAITQRFKSDEVYIQVEDEATILLEYEDAQGIIQASWNYPVTKTSLEVYGTSGYAHALDDSDVVLRLDEAIPETLVDSERSRTPYNNIVDHLVAVVRDDMDAHQTLSLQTNLIVSEILEAAVESAKTRSKVYLKSTEG